MQQQRLGICSTTHLIQTTRLLLRPLFSSIGMSKRKKKLHDISIRREGRKVILLKQLYHEELERRATLHPRYLNLLPRDILHYAFLTHQHEK